MAALFYIYTFSGETYSTYANNPKQAADNLVNDTGASNASISSISINPPWDGSKVTDLNK